MVSAIYVKLEFFHELVIKFSNHHGGLQAGANAFPRIELNKFFEVSKLTKVQHSVFK